MALLKTINALILGALLVAAPAFAEENPAFSSELPLLTETRMAPDVSLKDLNGDLRRLSDYRGKVVLLHFWACWCVPCIDEFPKIKWLSDRMRGKDFVILTVAEDSHKAAQKFVKERGIELPVLMDQYGSALRSYGIQALPSSYLIDEEGRIKGVAVGPRDWDSAKILDSIDAVMEIKRKKALKAQSR